MILVCTQDPTIVGWTANPVSGANHWGNAWAIPAGNNQNQATVLLGYAMNFLGLNEPLCLNCHGSDTLIGDAGNGPNDWTWNVNLIAGTLINNVPIGYAGPILIKSCATNITNFSARLAVCLQTGQGLNRVWIYGYNLPISVNQSFPDPANLANQVDLQGTQVVF
jgi:hypothetical protein